MTEQARNTISREVNVINDMAEIIAERGKYDRITDALLREIMEAAESLQSLLIAEPAAA